MSGSSLGIILKFYWFVIPAYAGIQGFCRFSCFCHSWVCRNPWCYWIISGNRSFHSGFHSSIVVSLYSRFHFFIRFSVAIASLIFWKDSYHTSILTLYFFCKSFVRFFFMFESSPNQVISHTDIKSSISLTRKDVDKVGIHRNWGNWIPAYAGMTGSIIGKLVLLSFFPFL